MEYFVEQAATHREAQRKVREKYGEQARIMHHRPVRIGGFLGMFRKEGVEVTGYFSEIKPRSSAAVQTAVAEPPARQPPQSTGGRSLEEEKRRLLEAARGRTGDDKGSMEAVLREIRGLRDSIQGGGRDHPAIGQVQALMEQNDFTRSYVRSILERMRSELTIEELDDESTVHGTVLGWIGDSILLYEPDPKGKPEILILVGPTGVGKTTTIAKLAAMYGLDRGQQQKKDIRILTIDNYRIGAKQQIETYGQIMDVPVSFVESTDDMKKYLALYEDADLIFIDTIGKSPRDFRKLGEMNELLALCGRSARVHLAVSATTKAADIAEITQQFEPFKYEAVVITKMDETNRAGNVISVLAERGKAISFLTDGQRVPQDIERASVMRLLMQLEGFQVSRVDLEKRFSKAS